MQEKCAKLYHALEMIEEDFLDYQNRKNLLPIREQLNNIQEFTLCFLQQNPLELDEQLYVQTIEDILIILKDIVSAIEENDYVLMHDAIVYGIMKYLKACSIGMAEVE